MSKRKESSASSPRTRCFANFHMTPAEYGVWDVLRSVSHTLGTLYFDGRAIAKYFAGTGKDVIYRIVKSLVRKGWLLVQAAGRNTRNGVFMPTQYQVLSHEQWAEDHPDECVASDPQDSIPENGNGSLPETESSRGITTGPLSELPDPVAESRLVQSRNPEQPVAETRMTSRVNATYSVKEISLSGDSAVRHAEEEDTDPSILQREARQRIENLDGWLAGRISSTLQKVLETVIPPTKQEQHKLRALTKWQDKGHLDVLLGFYHFAARDRKLYGLDYPISLFITQADQWIDLAVQKKQKHTNDAIEEVSRILDDFGVPDAVADRLYEPLCELAYLESDLKEEFDYDFKIVDEFLKLRYGPVQAESAAEVAA